MHWQEFACDVVQKPDRNTARSADSKSATKLGCWACETPQEIVDNATAPQTFSSFDIHLPVVEVLLKPQPAHGKQHNIKCRHTHTEQYSYQALFCHCSFAEIHVHDCHGHQVEEKVTPVQVQVRTNIRVVSSVRLTFGDNCRNGTG